MSARVRLELRLNTAPLATVQSAARGLMAQILEGAQGAAPAAGGVELESLKVDDCEYRVLAAGDWELGRLHDYIKEQRQAGWVVDTAYGATENAGEGGAAALQLWLRRERQQQLRAS
jgi:hypothetical protein